MKKLILALLAIASISAAEAQPHSLLVYGSASYDNSTINGSGYNNQSLGSSWSVLPGIGYQLNQHLTLGVQGGYSKTPTSEEYYYYPGVLNYSNTINVTNWSVGAFGRYTQWIGSIFFIYGQVNMGYVAVTNDAPDGVTFINPAGSQSPITDGNGFQAQIFPGVGINICKGFALNMSIGGLAYTSMSQTDGSYTVNHFNVNFGQELNIGVSKNFGGHMHHRHHHHGMEPGMELRHIDVSDDDDDDAPPPPVHKDKKHHNDDDNK